MNNKKPTVLIDEVVEGNCVDILRALPSASIDLVVTDPPYLVGYTDRSGRTIANDKDPRCVLEAFAEMARVLKPNSFCVSFYGWNHVDTFFNAWRQAGLRPVGHIVWTKDYASHRGFLKAHHEQAYLLAKGRPEAQALLCDVRPWEYTGNKAHPTEKAVSVIAPLIESFSKPGALVLDPFSGSGSTLVAAALSGRRYLGIELEQKYCQLARKRLAGVKSLQSKTP